MTEHKITDKSLFMVFDTETSGLPDRKGFNKYYEPNDTYHYDKCRLVQLGYIIIDSNGNEIKRYSKIITPVGFKITNDKYHGISHEKACTGGISIMQVIKEFRKDLGRCKMIIAHNLAFDYNILLSECYRNNFLATAERLKKITQFCTMENGRKFMNTRKSPKLTELFTYLYPNDEWLQIHNALDDTEHCLKCYKKLYSIISN
jgi:DNA polymerase-3 subunit alpha